MSAPLLLSLGVFHICFACGFEKKAFFLEFDELFIIFILAESFEFIDFLMFILNNE